MRNLILAAGVAALAIAVPAAAKPDKGGGGKGGGHAQVQRGGGGGGQAKAQRRGGGDGQARVQRSGGQRMAVQQRRGGGQAKAHRGGGQRFAIERRGGGSRQAQRIERGGKRFANFQAERGRAAKAQRAESRGDRNAFRVEKRERRDRELRVASRGGQRAVAEQRTRGNKRFDVRDRDGRDQRMAFAGGQWTDRNREFVERVRGDQFYDPRNYDRVYNTTMFVDRGLPASFVGGCPPGLAKKSPACMPPGLAQAQFVGQALPAVYASNYIPDDLHYLYADTPDYYYRWGDGYAYRVDRDSNLIAALLPLIGAGYGVGQYFPYYNQPSYYVPSYYQPFYPDTPYDYYRYDDGYVYRIDAGSGLIEDVIPLLDHGYGVGQMLPTSYSYYNVPYQYRDMYYDTPDYYYRYAPGAIYQVDRDTQLITALASLLTGGLSVGQPLPPAYSVYNVPIDYRDRYYDTPDSWYRYSDGYIYQVDPTTRLITAMVQALV